jgi:hypothetical protein
LVDLLEPVLDDGGLDAVEVAEGGVELQGFLPGALDLADGHGVDLLLSADEEAVDEVEARVLGALLEGGVEGLAGQLVVADVDVGPGEAGGGEVGGAVLVVGAPVGVDEVEGAAGEGGHLLDAREVVVGLGGGEGVVLAL